MRTCKAIAGRRVNEFDCQSCRIPHSQGDAVSSRASEYSFVDWRGPMMKVAFLKNSDFQPPMNMFMGCTAAISTPVTTFPLHKPIYRHPIAFFIRLHRRVIVTLLSPQLQHSILPPRCHRPSIWTPIHREHLIGVTWEVHDHFTLPYIPQFQRRIFRP